MLIKAAFVIVLTYCEVEPKQLHDLNYCNHKNTPQSCLLDTHKRRGEEMKEHANTL